MLHLDLVMEHVFEIFYINYCNCYFPIMGSPMMLNPPRTQTYNQQLFDRASYTKTRSAKQLTALIKQLLAHYHQLESNESLMEQLRLSPICTIDHHEEVGAIASHIRHAVQEALHEIAQKSQKNEQVCRILSLFYIEQVGTHEIVADRLHLSISTYYRYLRRAIELLTMYFMKKWCYSLSTIHFL